MSDAIFHWMPQLTDYSESNTFRTLRSQFENGHVQRRFVYSRPIGSWTFRYEMVHLSRSRFVKVLDAIYAFHVARKGSYDNFWIPSWRLEAEVVSNPNSTTIILNQDALQCGFVATPYAHGNFIYLTNQFSLHTEDEITDEVVRISSIDGNTLTLASSLNFYYSVGAKVMKAFKVYFTNDNFDRSYLIPYAYQADVSFTEDIGGYEEVVLP